jgi:hypothetical protein
VAKVEVVREQLQCDRPGCERRVTDKGGVMVIVGAALHFGPANAESDRKIDLCRECLDTMTKAWNRKADGE